MNIKNIVKLINEVLKIKYNLDLNVFFVRKNNIKKYIKTSIIELNLIETTIPNNQAIISFLSSGCFI